MLNLWNEKKNSKDTGLFCSLGQLCFGCGMTVAEWRIGAVNLKLKSHWKKMHFISKSC